MGFIADLFKGSPQVQAGQLSTTNYNPYVQQALGQPFQTGTNQQALAQALLQQMQGGGPNLAETQLQAATDRITKQGAGQIVSQRGLNPALGSREILQNQAQNQQAAANQAAQLRQQQQLMAQGQLGQVLGQERQQDIGQLGTLAQGQQAQNALLAEQQRVNAGVSQQTGQGFLGAAGAIGGSLLGLHEGGEVLDMESGGHVPGEAEVDGDSEKNDKVPAMLSPGELVVPRSVTQSLDPDKVRDFIEAFTGQKAEKKSKGGYARVLEANRKLRSHG